MSKKGFSLLELLVVILIIGILAAMMFPKYRKVVEKARAAEAIQLLGSVYRAQQIYRIVHHDFAGSFDDLILDFPGQRQTEKSNYWSTYNTDSIKVGKWAVEMEGGKNASISVGRLEGPFRGTGFFLQLQRLDGVNFPLDTIYCVEKFGNGKAYPGAEGTYCNGIIGGNLKHKSAYHKYTIKF